MPGLEDIHKKGLRERGVTKYRKVQNKKEGRGLADNIRNKVFDWLQDQPGFTARQRDIIAARTRAGSKEDPRNTMSILVQFGYPPLSGGDPRFLARKEFGVYELWIATERKPPNRKLTKKTVLHSQFLAARAKHRPPTLKKTVTKTTVTKKTFTKDAPSPVTKTTVTKKTITKEAKPKGTPGKLTVKAISKKKAEEKKGLLGLGIFGL